MSSVRTTHRASRTDAGSRKSSSTKIIDENTKKDIDYYCPEWNDTEINTEKWGSPLDASKRGSKTKKTATAKKEKSSPKRPPTINEAKSFEPEYEDPYPVALPWSLHKGEEFDMKRPAALFPKMKLVVYASGTICPNLVTRNRKLFHSEFIRSFATSVYILTYIGFKYPFTVEWQSQNFTANTSNIPWQPWHHVYSLCRTGANATHAPLANNLGKYVVRLYWLGCWRKVTVDDRIPVDENGRSLLPTSTLPDDKELELWPIILCKGLMKIASLTWTDKYDIVDFDIITCLTGWALQKISTKGLNMNDVWDIFCGYTDHFTWNPAILRENQHDPRKGISEEKVTKKDKKSGKKDKSTKSSKSGIPDIELVPANSFHLLATLADLRTFSEDDVEDITPCFSHDIFIEETRNIPLVKHVDDITQNLASWKLIRWLDWAIDHGFWDPEYTLENKKFIRLISNLRKVDETQIFNWEPSQRENRIRDSANAFKVFMETRDDVKDQPKKKGSISKKEKKEKKSRKGSKVKKLEEFVDPSIYTLFCKLDQYIKYISIYLKPSSFQNQYIFSDIKMARGIESKSKKKEEKKEKKSNRESLVPFADNSGTKYIYWENVLNKTRNEPIYLFTDSIDLKLTIFTLSHLGNKIPERIKIDKKDNDFDILECKKNICTSGNCLEDCTCQSKRRRRKILFNDTRKSANIIVEDFYWSNRQIGDMSVYINTFGTKSLLLNLPQGRFVKRIWLNTDSPYVLQVFCDDVSLRVGKVDEILECMSLESELLKKSCLKVCSAFGNIIRYFGESVYPETLRTFYKSYLPEAKLSKKQFARIHDAFLDEFIRLLTDLYPEEKHFEISRAIRIFLLDPHFRIPYDAYNPYYISPRPSFRGIINCECVEPDRSKIQENAAVKIQSFFKMMYMQKMKTLHKHFNEKMQKIVDTVKNVYTEIFSSKTRDLHCMKLLRSLMRNSSIKDLVHYFPYYNDLCSVVDLKQCTGEIMISDLKDKWVPITRKTFYCIYSKPVSLRAYIFSSLPLYYLRIFNNDTGEEIDRYTYNALVTKYEKNTKGYTIVVYGYTNESLSKHINWKLCVVAEKVFPLPVIDIDMGTSATYSINGNYIPNLNNIICTINLNSLLSSIGTLYFATSSDTVKIKIQCSLHTGEVIYEGYGKSSILIPNINVLRHNRTPTPVNDMQTNSLYGQKSTKSFKKIKSTRRMSSIHKSISMKRSKFGDKEDSSIPVVLLPIIRSQLPSLERDSIIQTDILIKIYVLDNSWPLNIREWQNVQKFQARSSIEHEFVNISSSLKSIMSVNVPQDPIKKSILKNPRRTMSTIKEILTEPYWIFICFYDSGNCVTVTEDLSRVEEIKEIKRRYILSDPERYYKGKKARGEFLEKTYLKIPETEISVNTSASVLVQTIDSTVLQELYTKSSVVSSELLSSDRKNICAECQKDLDPSQFAYLKPPTSLDKILPPFELNKIDENNIEYSWLVDEKRTEQIFSAVDEAVAQFEDDQWSKMTFINEYVSKSIDKYNLFRNWFRDIREDSFKISKDYENKKDEYITKMHQKKAEATALLQQAKKKK